MATIPGDRPRPARRRGHPGRRRAAPRRAALPNVEVARLLEETADLLELESANPFRVRAYRRAARTVSELERPVEEIGAGLDDLPGIGADLTETILTVARRGSFATLAELRRRVPRGLLELIRIRGLGPKRARRLHEALGVASLKDLEAALAAGRIRSVAGFGATMEAALRRELGLRLGTERRMLRWTAARYADPLVRHLMSRAEVDEVEVAGSFRRRVETVGDLDLLVRTRAPGRTVAAFVGYPGVTQVLGRGDRGASVRLDCGLQVDLRVLDAKAFGAGLYYFTGSKAHNIAVRRRAQANGLKLNEYGVFRGEQRIAGRTEGEVAAALGLPLIPPELREDRGEVEAALAGTLPALVRLEEIRGDLQVHTTDSDGRDDLETMVAAATARGYHYLAVTDHSPAVRVIRGLDAAGFGRQGLAIDRINAASGSCRVLKGAEVDILGDGRLDLDDETMARFDLVVAAVHTKLDLDHDAQTKRIVRALGHPSVHVLGHPTGRLIGERGPIVADWDRIFGMAAEKGVWLEVNAQPTRLDLDDGAIRAAIKAGASIVISTDAHATAELDFMAGGVEQARRGWAEAGSVVNTEPLEGLLERRRNDGVIERRSR